MSTPVLLVAELLIVLIACKVGLDFCGCKVCDTLAGASARYIEVGITWAMVVTVCRSTIERAAVPCIIILFRF
jgi:hypothetical protein